MGLLQIVIHSDNDEFPKLELTTFGTRHVFERLKQVGACRAAAQCVESAAADVLKCYAGMDQSKNSYCSPS